MPKYFELLVKDPTQEDALNAGVNSADDFIARAVAAAGKQGLVFSAEEATDYLDASMVEKADGELSDEQLESVAGGYFKSPSLSQWIAWRRPLQPPKPRGRGRP